MEKSVDNPLSQLRKAIIGQKSAALPDSPDVPALQSLHEKMADYDRYVSEIVIGVLGGGKDAKPYAGLQALQAEFDRQEKIVTDHERVILGQYRNYKNRLDNMLGLAVQVAQERSPQ